MTSSPRPLHDYEYHSILIARWLGYHRVADENVPGGANYFKNGKKWIISQRYANDEIWELYGSNGRSYIDYIRYGYAIEDYINYTELSVEDVIIAYYGLNSAEHRHYLINPIPPWEILEEPSSMKTDSPIGLEKDNSHTAHNISYNIWPTFLQYIEESCDGNLGNGLHVINGKLIDRNS